MAYLGTFDYVVIAAYAVFLAAMGLWLRKRASASLEDYFLGGRQLPWWALGISGTASFLDVTGTMVIVSFLFMLGPRGLFIEFRGGAVLVLAFMMVWTGKWHQRSGCMTEAEWNLFRFGRGASGHAARVVRAVAEIVFTVGGLAYLIKGIGLFLSTFLPFSPTACAIGMVLVASAYTITSGFYGVVITDIFQSMLVLCAVVIVTYLAVARMSSEAGDIAQIAYEVTGNQQWTSSSLSWRTEMPTGYEDYRALGMLVIFYLVQSTLAGMRSGADPKYFGARNERECGLLSFLWIWLMMLRWPLMMAIAILGLLTVREKMPDQSVLVHTVQLVRPFIGDVDEKRWDDAVAQIIRQPTDYPELVDQLETTYGVGAWQEPLKMTTARGTVNSERILPIVLLNCIPKGLRGLILVALIAASMSTFDSNLNKTMGFFTRDIYQAYLRPFAANRELLLSSYACGLMMVVFGFMLSMSARNINHIWNWIIMGLGAGLAVPGVLRLYWWRFNAIGSIVGTLVGMVFALVQFIMFPDLSPVWQFTCVSILTLSACIVSSYLTSPTPKPTLDAFYERTRPFGIWGPQKQVLSVEQQRATRREHRNDMVALPFVLVWQVTIFLLPMQLLIGQYTSAMKTSVVFVIALTGVYLFWYRNLQPADNRRN